MPAETAVQPSPAPVTDDTQISIADYRKERMGASSVTEPGKEVTPAQPPVTEPSKTAADSEPAKPEEKKTGQEAAENDKPESSYRKLQRRFDQLTREKGDLQRRLEALEQKAPAAPEAKPTTDPEPQQKDFSTYEDYIKSLTRWVTRQEQKALDEKAAKDEEAEQQKSQQEAWNEKVTAYQQAVVEVQEKHADFAEVLSDPKNVLPLYIQNAIRGMGDKGPEIAYQLAKNAEVRGKIVEFFNQGEHQEAWIEFGVFVRSLAGPKTPPKPPEKPVSTAPTPISPVTSGTGSADLDDEAIAKMSTAEYRRARQSGKIR